MSQQSKAPPAPRPTDLEQLAQRQDHLKTQCENERKELSKANIELRRLQESLAIKKQQVRAAEIELRRMDGVAAEQNGNLSSVIETINRSNASEQEAQLKFEQNQGNFEKERDVTMAFQIRLAHQLYKMHKRNSQPHILEEELNKAEQQYTEQQTKQAAVLSTLDTKIETERAILANLEKASALLKIESEKPVQDMVAEDSTGIVAELSNNFEHKETNNSIKNHKNLDASETVLSDHELEEIIQNLTTELGTVHKYELENFRNSISNVYHELENKTCVACGQNAQDVDGYNVTMTVLDQAEVFAAESPPETV